MFFTAETKCGCGFTITFQHLINDGLPCQLFSAIGATTLKTLGSRVSIQHLAHPHIMIIYIIYMPKVLVIKLSWIVVESGKKGRDGS